MPILEFHNGPLDGIEIRFERELRIVPENVASEGPDVFIYPYDRLFGAVLVYAGDEGVRVERENGESVDVPYGIIFLLGNTYLSIRKEEGG